MSFGSNVRAARTAAGMTQLELGRLSGYGRSSIANIEADNQDVVLHGLYAIADALGVTPASLLSGEGESNGQREVHLMRRALSRALITLEWEAERMRSSAASLQELADQVRALLNPANGDYAVSVAGVDNSGASQSGQEPAS